MKQIGRQPAIRQTPRRASAAIGFISWLLLLLCGLDTPAEAHPFHVSLAEVELNVEQRVLEVAIQVHPSDLEKALRNQTRNQQLVLEAFPGLKEELARYMQKRFSVRGPHDAKPLAIKWVGQTVDVKWAWLFFEIPIGDRDIDDLRFSSTVFLDLLNDQINTVNLRHGDRKASMQFHRKSLVQRIRWRAVTSPSKSQSVQD